MPMSKDRPARKTLPPGGYPSTKHLRHEDFVTNGTFDYDKATAAIHRLSFPRPRKE